MNVIRFAAAALLLVAWQPPVRAALTLPEVLQEMEQRQIALQDVMFDYTQTIRREDLPEQVSSGVIYAKKPHLLRVSQAQPERQDIFTDGRTLWLYAPAQKQVLKGDWKSWLRKSRFPVLLIDFVGTFTPERWRRDYTILFGGYDRGFYRLDFKPLNKTLTPVSLWISEKNFLPARGEMSDQGLRVQVSLKDVKTNTGIEEATFKPKMGSGTEEIPVTF